MSPHLVPLLIGRKVVATGPLAVVLDLCARLRARGIDATVPALCRGCGRRHRSVPIPADEFVQVLCLRCYRRSAAGIRLPIDYETEAERRGGAEPE